MIDLRSASHFGLWQSVGRTDLLTIGFNRTDSRKKIDE